jgi:hypothetical protein
VNARGRHLPLAVALALAAAPLAGQIPGLTGATVTPLLDTTPSQALERSGAEPTWIGWSVDAAPVGGHVCCGWRDGVADRCSLGDDRGGWSSSDRESAAPGRLFVLARAHAGGVERLRAFSPGCAVDGAGRSVAWLGEVTVDASLDLLEPLLAGRDRDDRHERHEVAERALATVAYHAGARADRILERRALDPALGRDAREQALFWSGHARGEAGYRLLDRVLESETDGDLREHALFALSQSSDPRAIERLKRAAAEDRDADVRAQGLFWLAQTEAPGAGDWILARLAAERDDDVRERAVFALSQLDDGADRLIAVLRTERDPDLVRQALFWLGQSDDPRALTELERILAP